MSGIATCLRAGIASFLKAIAVAVQWRLLFVRLA
jgi:hypothetical protein